MRAARTEEEDVVASLITERDDALAEVRFLKKKLAAAIAVVDAAKNVIKVRLVMLRSGRASKAEVEMERVIKVYDKTLEN